MVLTRVGVGGGQVEDEGGVDGRAERGRREAVRDAVLDQVGGVERAGVTDLDVVVHHVADLGQVVAGLVDREAGLEQVDGVAVGVVDVVGEAVGVVARRGGVDQRVGVTLLHGAGEVVVLTRVGVGGGPPGPQATLASG